MDETLPQRPHLGGLNIGSSTASSPKDDYFRLTCDEKTKTIPNPLLHRFADIPPDTTGDIFGQIYEYLLSGFARSEGQKGGEFFTPRSVVRLMDKITKPHGGRSIILR